MLLLMLLLLFVGQLLVNLFVVVCCRLDAEEEEGGAEELRQAVEAIEAEKEALAAALGKMRDGYTTCTFTAIAYLSPHVTDALVVVLALDVQ